MPGAPSPSPQPSKRAPVSSEPVWQAARAGPIRLTHAPLPHDGRLFVSALVRAGARDDPRGQEGSAHFLEHMMFRGSKNYPSFAALADAFEWLGGEWNAATGHEYTEYSYHGPVQSLRAACTLFADFLHEPLLLDFAKEQQVILREIEDELNEFGHSTDLGAHANELLWPHSHYAQPLAGTTESVEGMTIDHIRAFRQSQYRPERLALTVVGGDRDEPVLEHLQSLFQGYTLTPKPGDSTKIGKPKAPKATGPQVRVVPHSDNQLQMQLSFHAPGEWEEQAVATELLSYILVDGYSARLPFRLREELGLVYDVSATHTAFNDRGSLDLSAQITPDRILDLLGQTARCLMDLAHDGPRPEELEKAKIRSLSDLQLLRYRPGQLGFRLAWHQLWDRSPSFAAEEEAIRAVSVRGIQELCQKIFTPERTILVLLGPEQDGLAKQAAELLRRHLSG